EREDGRDRNSRGLPRPAGQARYRCPGDDPAGWAAPGDAGVVRLRWRPHPGQHRGRAAEAPEHGRAAAGDGSGDRSGESVPLHGDSRLGCPLHGGGRRRRHRQAGPRLPRCGDVPVSQPGRAACHLLHRAAAGPGTGI
ncbi:MAG: hypothetical protein AVDCRST_MAG88-1357, partial [uncultured Thermomicrobiales bacterium]